MQSLERPHKNLPPEYTQSASDDEPVESKTKTMALHQLARDSGPTQNGISYFFSLSLSPLSGQITPLAHTLFPVGKSQEGE